MAKLMNIGFGNMVNTDKIVCIVSSDSAPAKRMVQKGKEQENLIERIEESLPWCPDFPAREKEPS